MILLISNSWNAGHPYLEHALDWLEPLVSQKDVLILPYAAAAGNRSGVENTIGVLSRFGSTTTVAEYSSTAASQIQRAEAIFTVGGNTFRLLRNLQTYNLVTTIRDHITQHANYIGSSAGLNIACPTISTTNDMPIVETFGLKALGLVPYQINPHYIDDREFSDTTGLESRNDRLVEYTTESNNHVIALPEGDAILQSNLNDLSILGPESAYVFEPGKGEPLPLAPGRYPGIGPRLLGSSI